MNSWVDENVTIAFRVSWNFSSQNDTLIKLSTVDTTSPLEQVISTIITKWSNINASKGLSQGWVSRIPKKDKEILVFLYAYAKFIA